MRTILVIIIIMGIIAAWVSWGRPWLKTKPWAQEFFDKIEPIEIALWKKSEVILWARLKMLTGFVLTVLTQLQVIDITPLLPLIPDAYDAYVVMAFNSLPLVISFVGLVDEKLRRDTALPLEVVAMPAAAATPAVTEAIAAVKDANAQAVEVVAAAVAVEAKKD